MRTCANHVPLTPAQGRPTGSPPVGLLLRPLSKLWLEVEEAKLRRCRIEAPAIAASEALLTAAMDESSSTRSVAVSSARVLLRGKPGSADAQRLAGAPGAKQHWRRIEIAATSGGLRARRVAPRGRA